MDAVLVWVLIIGAAITSLMALAILAALMFSLSRQLKRGDKSEHRN